MKKITALMVTAAMLMPTAVFAEEQTGHEYEKGNFVNSYSEIGHDPNSRAWRDGMVGGNGETGFVTSGSPYSDVLIYQHMYFNYPSADPREIPEELTSQLEEARENVFELNDKWKIWDYAENGDKVTRNRTYYYSYHPGAQLRITSDYTDNYSGYERWTNYETAEVGVKYTDKYGEWKRTTFTSREDNVTITKISKSDQDSLINVTVSIDDISDMCKAWDGLSKVSELRYKKIVDSSADYIALAAHYPAYEGSELYDGGYASVTKLVVEGRDAKKEVITLSSDDPMLIGDDNSIKISDAESVYLITATDRSFEMTGETGDVLSSFAQMESYSLLEELLSRASAAADKYTFDGSFDYDAALAPSAQKHVEEFNRLTFDLYGDEEYADYDNNELISLQKGTTDRINHEFMERAYYQSRYAQICCGGTSAPRLYGMWTGEWNPGWRGVYTLDANVNLQVSAMNTGNLREMQLGYITFFLRHAPDFMLNAEKSYGMHDAIQVSVNADADRAMHVEYDSSYPFEYWNAGASWCLVPIYEYWQCYGNTQIPINDYMRIDDLQKVLSVNDGGLTDEEFEAIKQRGYLDLEKDILLPLLTKQANFWEQIVTPRYYTDVNGNACHDESKTELEEGEKYIIIPGYSPENHPIGYSSTLTANASMDIAAARDGLDMVCGIEQAVGREGSAEAIEKWQSLRDSISDYKFDDDGALREWAMEEYEENNNHRHLSHLYAAWPAYETQSDPELAIAANIALNNRNKYNTGDATAGHGWMHKALVEARLKRGDGMMTSLLKMMNGSAYYSSFMTDHDTNRRNDTYCTDTAYGSAGAVNEALAFSNTGEIEIIPALPYDWSGGKITGLMCRTRAEINSLEWSFEDRVANVTITSNKDDNQIKLRCGEKWIGAKGGGKKLETLSDDIGKYVLIDLNNGESITVEFELDEVKNELTVKNGDEEIGDAITINKGETITLTAQSSRNKYDLADWKTDSYAVAQVNNGVIKGNSVGVTRLTVSMGILTKEISINVFGDDKPVYKIGVRSTVGSDGYNSGWSVGNAFDGDVYTAYSSKDDSTTKYIEAELSEKSVAEKMYVVGRYTEGDGNGTYAARINGAKIYASNEPMRGDTSKGVLVGEISGVTATDEYIPAEIEIDTNGEGYKYYMIYLDKVNNGKAISLAVSEIEFCSTRVMGTGLKVELRTENALLAVDGDVNTAQTAADGEFLFEVENGAVIDRVIVKKQKNAGGTSDNDYWADWVLAVGCEVQGSTDGETWETIGKMNPAPDGMDDTDSEEFILDEPKTYKYIRYVRTEIKNSSSYGAWLFPSDYGNRLNLADIEVYSPYMVMINGKEETEDAVRFNLRGSEGMYDAYLAMYNENGELTDLEYRQLIINNDDTVLEFEKTQCSSLKLYVWNNNTPVAQAAEISHS